MTGAGGATRTMRLGVLGVATLSALAIGFELYSERHWGSGVQLIAWGALLVLLAAIVPAFSARRGLVLLARVLAGAVLVASAVGIYQHITGNYSVGALDQAYSGSWESLPPSERLLLAVTKTVGPNPPLAPGALAQAAVLVLLATVGRRGGPARGDT